MDDDENSIEHVSNKVILKGLGIIIEIWGKKTWKMYYSKDIMKVREAEVNSMEFEWMDSRTKTKVVKSNKRQ